MFRTGFLRVVLFLLLTPTAVQAQIRRWDDGAVIRGTEGIAVAPGAQLDHLDLSYAHFLDGWPAGSLQYASFEYSNLAQALFSEWVSVTGASFTSASVSWAIFEGSTLAGFRKEQLYSTASYHARDLVGIALGRNDLAGWDFRGLQLASANFRESDLTSALFEGANVNGALFFDTTRRGFTPEQLYSTASYQQKEMGDIDLGYNELSGWDFAEQDLTGAKLYGSDLSGTDFANASVSHALFDRDPYRDVVGLSAEQLYSTASYQQRKLAGISLSGSDLRGWNFRGQNLVGAGLVSVDLSFADLRGANLASAALYPADPGRPTNLYHADFSGANLRATQFVIDMPFVEPPRLEDAVFDGETTYDQWTRFPADFDPVAVGLRFVLTAPGDLDGLEGITAEDFDFLLHNWYSSQLQGYAYIQLDLNRDQIIDAADVHAWIKDIWGSWIGDTDLDRQFDSADLVRLFEAGEYEDERLFNSTWTTGDWDGDEEFTSADMVLAFQDGGYEQGARVVDAAVPEPASAFLLLMGLVGLQRLRRPRI